MKDEIRALLLKSRLPWLLTATVVLAAPGTPAVAASHPATQASLSWVSYHPNGWSEGSVARGTGYYRPGASRRVREVQRRLNRLGFASGPVDGLFGPITQAAVRAYQRESGLEVDGIVGPRTLHGLRSRTRRAQGSANQQTSTIDREGKGGKLSQATRRNQSVAPTGKRADRAAVPARWGDRETVSGSSQWWMLVPLLAAAIALALVAAGLLLRALAARSTIPSPSKAGTGRDGARRIAVPLSEPEIEIRAANGAAEEPMPAGVTSLSSRRYRHGSRHRVAEVVAVANGDRVPNALDVGNRVEIVRRIEQTNGRHGNRAWRPTNGTGSGRAASASDSARPFSVLGVRIHLSVGLPELPGTLAVELELFVEGQRRRWETGLLETGRPFRISLQDVEGSVHSLVVPDYLPALADALVEAGLDVAVDDLASLAFAVEPTVEVERVIAEKRGEMYPAAG
jgi:hypothetical protein